MVFPRTVGVGNYGQNMACGNNQKDIGKIISDQFYNGEINYFGDMYGEANPSMSDFEKWGHFTQVVWNASTKVGCATQYCSGGVSGVGPDVPPYLTFCNYGSPGKFICLSMFCASTNDANQVTMPENTAQTSSHLRESQPSVVKYFRFRTERRSL